MGDEGYFTFTTGSGSKYVVLFALDEHVFSELNQDGKIIVYEVMVNPEEEGQILPLDAKVGQTVCQVIMDFIDKHDERIIVYVCEDNDGREGKRQKLFQRWFDNYVQDETYYKVPLETETRFTSVIFKEGNIHTDALMEKIAYYSENPQELDKLLDSKGSA